MSFLVVKVLMAVICFLFIVRIYLRFIAIVLYTTYPDIHVINKQQNGIPQQIVFYFQEEYHCIWYRIFRKNSIVKGILFQDELHCKWYLIFRKNSIVNGILFSGRMPLQIVSYFMEDFHCKWYFILSMNSTVNGICK